MAPPDRRFTSPESYTPRHLAQEILTEKSALEGERKQVTVFFADLAGSSLLAERIGPEGMYDLLNRFFELALATVHRYEGTINQFLGDGFMALFGAPLAHEHHARHAVLTALDLRRALGERFGDLERTAGITLRARIGLNTGLAAPAPRTTRSPAPPGPDRRGWRPARSRRCWNRRRAETHPPPACARLAPWRCRRRDRRRAPSCRRRSGFTWAGPRASHCSTTRQTSSTVRWPLPPMDA
jgi:hypothetical protein